MKGIIASLALLVIIAGAAVLGGAMLLSEPPISEDPLTEAKESLSETGITTYTSGRETHCWEENGRQKCYTTLYSGIRFVQEDNTWKPVEEARSLKGIWNLVWLEADPSFNISVIDFNYTDINLELQFNGDPLDYPEYCPTYKGPDEFKCQFKLQYKEDGIDIKFDYKYEVKNGEIVQNTNKFSYKGNPLGKNFTLGGNSTTIQLQDPDTENLADVQVKMDDMFTWVFMKFNISSLTAGGSIESGDLWLYCYADAPVLDDDVRYYRLPNQTWVETASDVAFDVMYDTKTDTTTNTTALASCVGWMHLDVTAKVNTEYGASNDYVSFILEDPDYSFDPFGPPFDVDDTGTDFLLGTVGTNTDAFFWAKEYGVDTTKRPYLNITYVPPPPSMPYWHDNTTNTTGAGSSVKFSVRWTDSVNLDSYVFGWYNGANWTQILNSADKETGESSYSGEAGPGAGLNMWDSFENNFTEYWIDDGISEKWTRDTDGTPSSGTGPQPQGSASGAEGEYYIYVETSSAECYSNGETAIVYQTPEINWDAQTGEQISWYNYMLGSDIGVLALEENSTGSWVELWTMSGDQGTGWFQNTTDLSSLNDLGVLRFYYTCDGGYYGDTSLDAINITSDAGAASDTDANKTPVTYNNVISGYYRQIDNITVTVNVSYYDTTGSINNSNTNATLYLDIYNGTDWLDEGDFQVTSAGNWSKTITTVSVLRAWESNSANADINISAMNLDYNSPGNFDNISWADVFVKVESQQEFLNDSHVSFTDCPTPSTECYSNISKTLTSTLGATIKWYVWVNDTDSHVNQTDIFQFITTTADPTPPDITFLFPTPNNDTNLSQDNYYVNVSISESASSVLLELTNTSGTINYTMVNEAGNWYNFNVTGQDNNMTYLFVYATDTADNLNRSLERFINISVAPPAGDTCDTCNIDCTESCTVDSNLECQAGFNATGSGPISIENPINITGAYANISMSCYFNCTSGRCFV